MTDLTLKDAKRNWTSAFNGSRTGNDKEFIMEYSVLNTKVRAEEVMGWPDSLKLKSSMTLFSLAKPEYLKVPRG